MTVSENPLRIAFAGCHRMLSAKPGSHNFAAAFAALPDIRFAAVYDRDEATRLQFRECWAARGDVAEYDSYDRMVSEARPDIVCIATRQTQHADQVERAVAAGARGIFLDKPLVTCLDEADRVVAACRDVPLFFALDRRMVPQYCNLRQQLSAGLLGDIATISAYGLPNVINHGCHWYDTLLALAGDPEPAWVSGFVDDLSNEPPDSRAHMDPAGRAQIGLRDGRVLSVSADGKHLHSGNRMAFDIIGEKGRVFVLNDALECYLWLDSETQPEWRRLDLPPGDGPWPAGSAMARSLVAAVSDGLRSECDVGPARRATEIGFAIHLSSQQNGARIDLPAAERSLRIESFPWGNE